MWAQRAFSSVSASALSDQNLHWFAFWTDKNAKFLHVDNVDWSEYVDAQAGLSLGWAIMKARLFKYIENFISKHCKFSDKKLWYFSYFCSKHRLWVLVRTALAVLTSTHNLCFWAERRGGSNEYPQSMFLSRNKKNNVYPGKPQFYSINVGFKGVNII